MVKEQNGISNIKEHNDTVNIAKNGESMPIKGSESVELENCIFKEVYYVPDLSRNLLSVNSVTNSNDTVYVDNKKVFIMSMKMEITKDTIVIEGQKNNNGLYVVKMKKEADHALVAEKNQ